MAAVDKTEEMRKPEGFIGHRNRNCEKNRGMRYFRANRKIVNIGAVFKQFAPLNALVSKLGFWTVFIHSKSEVKFASLLVIYFGIYGWLFAIRLVNLIYRRLKIPQADYSKIPLYRLLQQ